MKTLAIILILAFLVACTTHRRHRVRRDMLGEQETVRCVEQCRAANPKTGVDFGVCVDECPNVEVKDDVGCGKFDVPWANPPAFGN